MSEASYSKIDLAIEQLEMAISIFLNGSSLASALTLAGAAEEILGQALKHVEKHNSLQSRYEAFKPLYQALDKKLLIWRNFVDKQNYAKNSVKHMRDKSEVISLDLEDAALWMIVWACDNADRLDLPTTPKMEEFSDWFQANVVGLENEY